MLCGNLKPDRRGPIAAVGTYSWKTLSGWKGTCRTLTVKFSDGQEFRANFKFS